MTTNMPELSKLDLLIAIYILCVCLAELMGAKTFQLINFGDFKLNASVAIFLVPVLFSINDIIVETYGAERARGVVRSGFIVICMIIIFTLIATKLPPSQRFVGLESAYDSIFTLSTRISLASLIAFMIAHLLDIAIFVKIRNNLSRKSLWVRNNLSNFIAQFFDTALFITLAFYTFEQPITSNINFLTSLILPYWLLKCLMSVIETPFVYLGIKWLKGGNKK